ncbi:hypothetical protein OESDEN_08718 [Oesophagostomum dentatum]|uniref:7TM GPCR serpentine receptor class x (Srx) domain-containing protein n=1 Tax=Oesophagostomum dentatum TaxID=61180 RepID=A0A0B1T1I2_OESDE|nr:hypothetical protein OESDEN_08718 [Oesophagostomum dentatum]
MDATLLCFRSYHPQTMNETFRILSGAALFLTTVISLALNFMLGYVVYSTSVFEDFFRWHVVSLVCSDLVYLLGNCTTLIPSSLFNIYIRDPLNSIVTLPNLLGYNALLFTTTFIAADRFLFFFYRKEIINFAKKPLKGRREC